MRGLGLTFAILVALGPAASAQTTPGQTKPAAAVDAVTAALRWSARRQARHRSYSWDIRGEPDLQPHTPKNILIMSQRWC